VNARRWYDFGRFRLDSQRRELLADGIPVAIGSRALDVLTVLIEACGELVTKDELSMRAWSGIIVEENTLQFQISTLRKALGPDRNFIKTISGRGYSFVAEITTVATPEEVTNAASAAPRRDLPRPNNLPVLISNLVGRETQLSDVVALVATHRLVTLVGAGGIGKTRLGLEVARCLVPQFTDGTWLVGLGPLSGPELVLPTIATTLGLTEAGPTTPERVAEALAPKHLLLLLDNCEHVIDASARIAEVFLQTGASLRVIATSREPLRVDGECVYRVPPLDVPTEDSPDGDDPLRYGAVRLFVERARTAEATFCPEGQAAAAIGSVCRRLDGIPLAIELAASRAAALGVGELATHLDARFDLLTDGRRTALPQHRT
jgi:DNA-binding winged helix-turn-helix (wHTH) protein